MGKLKRYWQAEARHPAVRCTSCTDFYIATDVDQAMTQALELANLIQQMAARNTHFAYLKEDPEWQLAQRFIEEYGDKPTTKEPPCKT